MQGQKQDTQSKTYRHQDQIQDLERRGASFEQKRQSIQKGDIEKLQRDSMHLEEIQDEIDYYSDIKASHLLQNQKYKQKIGAFESELSDSRKHNTEAV